MRTIIHSRLERDSHSIYHLIQRHLLNGRFVLTALIIPFCPYFISILFHFILSILQQQEVHQIEAN